MTVIAISFIGSPLEFLRGIVGTLTNTMSVLMPTDQTAVATATQTAADGLSSAVAATELVATNIIYIIIMLMCVVKIATTAIDIAYISFPEFRETINRLKLASFKIEYENGLVELAQQMGIEVGLLPTLYNLEIVRGADKSNHEKPFTATIKIKSRYKAFKELAQEYKDTQYFSSFKDRDNFLKQLETELSNTYNDVMYSRLSEITDPEDITILKKVLCNFGGISEENEIATCSMESHYRKESNTISCKVTVHPKSALARERFENMLSEEADAMGNIVIAGVFDDIVQVVKFIRETKDKIMDTEEVNRIKELIQQDILSEMKPLEIEDDTVIHNMKSTGKAEKLA
jgi:hypothetical protein